MRAILLFWLFLLAATPLRAADATPVATTATASPPPATLRIDNRDVVVFRSMLLGYPPAERAAAANSRVEQVLERHPDGKLQTRELPQGTSIQIDDRFLFMVGPGDADALTGETRADVVRHALTTLNTLMTERRELRSPARFLFALLRSALILLGVALALTAGARATASARRLAETRLTGNHLLFRTPFWQRAVRGTVRLASALWVLAVLYIGLSMLLSTFPITRAWGEALDVTLLGFALRIGLATVDALPGIGVVLVIIVLTRWAVQIVHYLLSRVESGELTLPLFDQDTAGTTRKLLIVALWLFALAMMYPYFPGANTDAFKGLSVVIGLMVSLGASSVVGQFASGLILIYSHAIRPGEYVSVGEIEGTVANIGLFATKIHTNLREEVSIPNSVLVSQSVKNFSRLAHDGGVIQLVTLTIGYGTPWRQVEAMLLMAADRTSGVRRDPKPFVFQTRLSDYYVEYSLRVALDEPRERLRILDELHSHILDVFNEYGVQITSPNYEDDPHTPQMVAPEDWYPPPARRPPA